ncbi:VWA domain-containing protein [Streptomyces mobaraensis]|uniref:VWA domain-containing protein n=1 Tax=Streptomyces mobaraensis TaxID=35621 RepID=UPI0023B133F7|nr:VWA domain-containing protein [Streptomyces mobaraensis]
MSLERTSARATDRFHRRELRRWRRVLRRRYDGGPDQRTSAAQILRKASHLPLFWAFGGFGDSIHLLEKLDGLGGRVVNNAGLLHAASV